MKMMDTFEALARSVLADDRVTLDRLLALRQQAQNRLRALPATGGLSAAQINSLNQRFFDEAAQLLGRNGYERLFGEPPGEVTLVDPAQFAEAEKAKAEPGRASSTSVTRRTSGTSIVSTRRRRDGEESRASAPARATKSAKPAAKKSPRPKKKAGKKATSKKKAAPRKKAAKKSMKKKAPKKSMKKRAPKKSMKKRAPKKSMKKAAKKSMKKKAAKKK